jgi:hypothetical protein
VRLIIGVIALCSVCFFAEPAAAQPKPDVGLASLSIALEQGHLARVQQLSSAQVAAIETAYPGFRILSMCVGRFSGGDTDELVLWIWTPVESLRADTSAVQRVGLVWSQKRWQVHSIDDEIKKDEHLSRSFPMNWEYTLSDTEFIGSMKCGIESEFGKKSELKYGNGNRTLFSLKRARLQKSKVICFATSSIYNNWDCLVYSPKDRRFRLWFQQVYAD